MSALTPADILDKAANVIPVNGFYQGDYYDAEQSRRDGTPPRDCAVCAIGAMIVGSGDDPVNGLYMEDRRTPSPATRAAVAFAAHLVRTFHIRDDKPQGVVGYWNDEPERTAEQVVAELRACAADLRKEAK